MSGDIHNLEYSERMKFLNKLSNSKHIVKAETKIVGNESELRKAVKWASSQEGSEGSYLKRLDFPYELDGKTNLNIKYKNTFSIDVEVKDIHKVSGAESWNYLCTIKDGKRDVPIGRTYNTSIKLSEGDIVKVEFVNLNKYFDVKLKRGWYNWWSPRPIMARKDKKRPDNVDTADELVKASNGEIKNRRASIALDGDPYMMVPAEDKKILGMAHMHVRGKSVTDRTPIIVRDLETGDVSVIPIKDVFSPKELVKEKITEKEVDNLEVWTALGWSRILHAYRHRQDKPPIRLKCQEGLVEVTEDHSLFQNGVPVMTKALTVGESLDMADLPVLEGEEDVDKGLAWLYGFYLAEGNREKRGIGLTSGDMSLLERAQRIVSRLGFATNICVTHSQLKLNHSPCWKLEIGRLDISSFFETGGVHEVAERRARWKIVPVFVFSWNVESQRAFLEGYFDGDGIGIAYEKKKIEWASASQALAQGVLLIARRVFPEYPNYSIVWQDAVVRINLRQGTGNRLDSREEIKSIIPGRFHETKRGAKNPNYRGGQYVEKNAEKGVWYYSKQRWVYDIETESHDFIAGVGRVIAHNSVHIDLRFGVTKDWAVGWTLYIPKGLSKVPETFTEAKTLVDKEIMPIVKEKLKDPTQKFNCGTKAVEPIEWLDYQGRVEKGEVGATKNEPGYFYIIDRFDAEFGAQKCMVGKTQLIVKDEDGHIKRADIRSIVKQKRNVSVLTPTGFAGIKDYVTIPVDFDALREIKLDNGSSIKCDDNHPSFCLRDNQIYKLPAKEIKEGDLIPIFSDGYDGAGGNYNMGRFIGLYLAEGSIAKSSKQLMSFAFHERETEYISFIAQYAAAFGARSILRMTKESSGIHVELSQAGGLIGLIDQFIKREDKSLRSNVFGLCRECRQGVIDGMHEGDNNDTPSVKYSEIAQGQPHLELGKDIHQLLFSLGNVASLKYNTQSIRKYGTRVAIAYDLTNFTKGWWHQYAINGQLFIKVKKIKKLNKWDVGNTVKELFDVELEGDHRIVLANGIITSNSHYHEYFCDGKIFDGRFCVRLLENKEEWKKTGEGLMTWMASTALTDKTPYVLGRRAITKKWVPPYGHSALPEKIRSKVPKEYQYWNSRDPKKRLEIRDSLIAEIKKTRISIDALGPVSYKVLKQTFKKQTVIREGPTRTRYFFVICKAGVQKLSLAFLNNPLEQNELTGIKTKDVKLCGYRGHENQVKPGTELNKTKATPSNIEVLEAGKATALVDRAVKEYKLKEGRMKGNWILYNEEEGSAMWVLKRIVRAS